ncbi:MAG: universal stress protein [Desulfarculaceae bacterium]|nr:universal stress protein [Desulfarculaceae bacterium]MCF8046422.1 universal stress protein [Desulfarculaceae bacterium]MCF8065489.1 universal stress protein [Desulfarculaceae bacterium]MCF8098242.1 universal stress protein [Desulfarculaceae bacterium]MCF8123771.1 universal stress protein [Desulfarculaceae bacterium]
MSPQAIDKVLCSIDFSDFSPEVLAQAVVLAHKYGAELLVLNVVNERAYEELERVSGRLAMLNGVADQAINAMEEHQAEMMRDLLGKLKQDGLPLAEVKHSSRIAVGLPYERILEVAEEFAADLIIMGAKGRTSFTKTLRFGSTAEKVFRRAGCKVMFVR